VARGEGQAGRSDGSPDHTWPVAGCPLTSPHLGWALAQAGGNLTHHRVLHGAGHILSTTHHGCSQSSRNTRITVQSFIVHLRQLR
jgi:hypothetical protein